VLGLARLRVVGETKYSKEELAAVVVEHLKRRLSEIGQQVNELEKTINDLEERYGVSWEVFEEKFKKGNLAEEADLDYIEWQASMELLKELRRERDQLMEVLG